MVKLTKSKEPTNIKKLFASPFSWIWKGSTIRRIFTVFLAVALVFTGSMYGVAEWYIHKHASEPVTLGASFVPDYAKSFGLDPNQALDAMLGQLGLKHVRLVSYWSDIEPTQGSYDFKQLDQEFAIANKYGTKVSLSIGLRQPRWPECHEPSWADSETTAQWQPQLYKFMTAVVNRYKNNPALESYELENEFFMKVFGTCTNFDRNRLVSEFKMVKKLDAKHPVIISRSDNWIGIPVGQPTPDEFAISVYKRVWDATFTHRYFEYPLPPWFYSALAGSEELWSGKNMIIHELQAEPWAPNGLEITQISTQEQFKSMNADILAKRIKYGEDTGMKTIDLWGAEWWYWLKVDKHDPSVWNVVKQAVAEANAHNQTLASH